MLRLHGSFVKTVICPAGNVVLNIFRNYIPIMRSTYYMVIIATLPPEFNIIAQGIHCDGPLKSTYYNRQRRPKCMDARLVRPYIVSYSICLKGNNLLR